MGTTPTAMPQTDNDVEDQLVDPGLLDEDTEMADQKSDDTPLKKRRRPVKPNLDKKFECKHEGCGKSYSRAEHLYRHQLNREFVKQQRSQAYTNMCQTPPRRFTVVITPTATGTLCGKICVLDIVNATQHMAVNFKSVTPSYRPVQLKIRSHQDLPKIRQIMLRTMLT